jgi:hypothetical protein
VRDGPTRADLADWWTQTWKSGGAEYARQVITSNALYADLEIAFSPIGFAAASVVVVVCVDDEQVQAVHARHRSIPPFRISCWLQTTSDTDLVLRRA